jgi:hypothetical protein
MIVLSLFSRESSREICDPIRSSFELGDCALGERRIAVQIVGVEDRAHVAQRVPGDARDLSLAASDDGKARDRSAAQIVKGHADDPGLGRGDAPRGLKAVRCPRASQAIRENERSEPASRI